MSHDNGYGNKVIGEYKMLKAVASGSKVSTLAQAKTTDKRSARQRKVINPSSLSTQERKEQRIHDNPALL